MVGGTFYKVITICEPKLQNSCDEKFSRFTGKFDWLNRKSKAEKS